MTTQSRESRGKLQILLAAILWGTTGTSQALAPTGADPLSVGAIRLAIGGGALLLIAAIRGHMRRDCVKQPWVTLLAAALVAIYQLSFFAAVSKAGVAIGTMVGIGSGPVFAGLFGFMAHRERPGRKWLVATGLAVCGLLVLFVSAPAGTIRSSTTGVLLALVAGASYAGYALAIKQLLPGRHPDAVVAEVFALGALLLSPLLFRTDFTWMLEPRGVAVILHLGLITTSLAYLLFAHGLRTVPTADAVTLSLAEPLTAATLGLAVLGEKLTAAGVTGMSLIFAGLIILGASGNKSYKS